MAIKIKKPRKNKAKIDPYYILRYNYMIGDADGYTTEESEISIDNPYVERYVTLLNKLKPTKGHWGLSLDEDDIEKCFKEGQITKDSFEFLKGLMFEESFGENEDSNEDKFKYEFWEGVRSETEYSFLVFQGADLIYVDENGKENETEIVKEKKSKKKKDDVK